MFFYLYDAIVLDKKFAGLLERVESRIIELGINGRIERLTPLRNIKELIANGVRNGAHTVVVLGTDNTFLHAMQVVAREDVTLGFLPFGESTLGALFGITDPLEGCNSLSRRITKQLALGKANQTFFLNTITATVPSGTQLKCNNQWSLITRVDHSELTVANTGALQITVQPQTSAKGFLHKAKPFQATRLVVKELKLEHPDTALPLLLDGETTLKTPVTITIKPKAIKVIVGKHRLV